MSDLCTLHPTPTPSSSIQSEAYAYPYLLGFLADAIEVITLINGNLVKVTHILNHACFLL